MSKIVFTSDAPRPLGPYSQAIISEGFVFCSGQIGIDPSTGMIVSGGIEEETKQVLTNLDSVLKSAGSCIEKVVRCTIYITDMTSFPKVNEIYAKRFAKDPPSRTTIGVLSLPMKALVEIDAIAEIRP